MSIESVRQPNHLILCHPFSSCSQSFPASESFPISQLFTSGGQTIGASASAAALPVNIQGWFPLGWTGWISLQSKGLSRVFSSATWFESISSSALNFIYGPTVTSIQDYWKSHSFDYTGLCQQVMCLLFNMQSIFVIAFLPRSKHHGCSHHLQWFWSP